LKQSEKNSTQDAGKKKHLAFLDMLLKAEENGESYTTHKDIRDQVNTFMFEVSLGQFN